MAGLLWIATAYFAPDTDSDVDSGSEPATETTPAIGVEAAGENGR